jgi:hypothetical protein
VRLVQPVHPHRWLEPDNDIPATTPYSTTEESNNGTAVIAEILGVDGFSERSHELRARRRRQSRGQPFRFNGIFVCRSLSTCLSAHLGMPTKNEAFSAAVQIIAQPNSRFGQAG